MLNISSTRNAVWWICKFLPTSYKQVILTESGERSLRPLLSPVHSPQGGDCTFLYSCLTLGVPCGLLYLNVQNFLHLDISCASLSFYTDTDCIHSAVQSKQTQLKGKKYIKNAPSYRSQYLEIFEQIWVSVIITLHDFEAYRYCYLQGKVEA